MFAPRRSAVARRQGGRLASVCCAWRVLLFEGLKLNKVRAVNHRLLAFGSPAGSWLHEASRIPIRFAWCWVSTSRSPGKGGRKPRDHFLDFPALLKQRRPHNEALFMFFIQRWCPPPDLNRHVRLRTQRPQRCASTCSARWACDIHSCRIVLLWIEIFSQTQP